MRKGRLNISIEDKLYNALKFLAAREHRSMNNMVELLIIKEADFREIDIESLEEKAPA